MVNKSLIWLKNLSNVTTTKVKLWNFDLKHHVLTYCSMQDLFSWKLPPNITQFLQEANIKLH